MSASKLSREVSRWIKDYGFCERVEVGRTDDHHVIEFEVRTTSTRASSMVTRIKLIVAELSSRSDVTVDKELMSRPPETRDALATWSIYVAIPVKRRLACVDTCRMKGFDDLACKAEAKIRRENTRK